MLGMDVIGVCDERPVQEARVGESSKHSLGASSRCNNLELHTAAIAFNKLLKFIGDNIEYLEVLSRPFPTVRLASQPKETRIPAPALTSGRPLANGMYHSEHGLPADLGKYFLDYMLAKG